MIGYGNNKVSDRGLIDAFQFCRHCVAQFETEKRGCFEPYRSTCDPYYFTHTTEAHLMAYRFQNFMCAFIPHVEKTTKRKHFGCARVENLTQKPKIEMNISR